MKTVKKVFCLFLALALCMSFFPVATAAEGEPQIRNDAELELQAQNSLGRVLLNGIQHDAEETEEAGPCHVNGVSVEDDVVTVSYNTDEDAQVVVAIYEDAIYDDDPDVLKLLTTVMADAPANMDLVELSLSEEIPATFIVGAYLLRTGSHEPLCEEYVSRYYTAEFQAFLNAPLSEYEAAGDRLVVFTPGKAPDGSDANFGILAEDVAILRETAETDHLSANEDGSYTITAADAAALALQNGDKLAHWSLEHELTLVFVTGLTVENDSVSLTDDTEAEADIFFEVIRINADTSGAEQTVDCSNMDEGVTVLTDEDVSAEVDQIFAEAEASASAEADGGIEYGESGIFSPETGSPEAACGTAEPDGMGPTLVMGSPPGTHKYETDLKLDVDLFKTDKEKSVDPGTGTSFWDGSGTAGESSYEVNVKLSFKGALTFQYYISSSWKYTSTELSKSFSITGSVKGKIEFLNIELPDIRVALFPGINAVVTSTFVVSFEAKLSFTVAWEEKSGFEYDSSRPKGSEWKEISSETGLEPKTTVKLEGTLSFSFKIEVGIEVLNEKVGFISLNIEPGVRVTGSMSSTDDLGETDPTAESIHDCDLCTTGEIYFFINASVELKILKDILKDKATLTWEICNYTHKICDFYASLSGGDLAFGLGLCPNRRYRLTLTTLSHMDVATKTVAIGNLVQIVHNVSYNYDLTPFLLKDMAVSITSTDGKYVQDAELITGEDGSISVFLPSGEYRIKAYGGGWFGEKIYKIDDKAREYYMVLEEAEKKEGDVTDKDGAVIHWDYYNDGILILSGSGEIPDYTDQSAPPWQTYATGYEEVQPVHTIIIRNGITRVGNWAFEGYNTLTDLQIGATVTEIGEDAFRGAINVERVSIPRSVTSIRENAFKNWNKLKEVVYDGNKQTWRTLREHIESGNEPLLNAKLIFNASIIDSGQCGDNLFWTLSSAGTLTITGSGSMWDLADETEQWWANDREDIEDLVLETGITRLSAWAFYGCGQLTEVTIPDTVTEIGAHAFEACEKLVTVWLPGRIGTIPDYAFKNCKNLLEIKIPFSVTRIGYGAFSGCTKMQNTGKKSKSVRYLGMETEWDEVDVAGNNTPLLEAIVTYSDNTIDLGSCGPELTAEMCGFDDFWILIVKGDGQITDGAITETPWKDQVKEFSSDFAHWSVKGTDLITELRLSEGVTKIPGSAFSDCKKLTYVTIPETVTDVGKCAFANCTSLTEMSFPNSVESFGQGALFGCSSLTSLSVPFVGSSRTQTTSPDNSSAFAGLVGFFRYRDQYGDWHNQTPPTSLKTVHVTDATQIPDLVFNTTSARYLTTITLNDEIASIGSEAFSGQIELETLHIPSDLTSLGSKAFYGCSMLREIKLPEGVTTISASTFYGCSGLTKIRILGMVTSIGKNAFYSCSGLTELFFCGTMAQWQAISISSGNNVLTSITIHCSDGDLALAPEEELEDLEEPEDGEIELVDDPDPTDGPEPTVEPEPVDEPAPVEEPEPIDEPEPGPVDQPEPEPGNVSGYISLASFSGTESPATETVFTASFGGLMPGEEYLILAVRSSDELVLLDNDNILFVGQKTAGEDGTLTIRYVKKSSDAAVLRCYGMSDKCFTDSDKLAAVFSLGTNGSAAYTLAVTYDCTELEENKDFLVSFASLEDDVVEITVKGICDYSGMATILAKVSCTEEDSIDGYAVIHKAHDWAEWGVTVPAGCEEPGEEGRVCAGCGKTETRELEPVGHDWGEPAWIWAEDYGSAQAVFTCSHDESHVTSLQAEVIAETTEHGICYTAAVTFGGETYTDQKLLSFVTLSLDAQSGTVEPESVRIVPGEAVGELPTPERAGWIFLGWFTEPAATQMQAGQGTAVTAESVFDANATVYAHWRLPDDLNGDGKANTADVTMLAKYVKARGQGVEIVPGAGNVDGSADGRITTADVALLAKYVKARGQGVVIY